MTARDHLDAAPRDGRQPTRLAASVARAQRRHGHASVQLRMRDAPSLLRHMNDPAVLQFIAPCPIDGGGLRSLHPMDAHGAPARTPRLLRHRPCRCRCAPWASSSCGRSSASSRPLSGVLCLVESFWGTGVFTRSAQLLLDAVFLDSMFGSSVVLRLEARAVDHNDRGNRFFAKLGATREGVLRGGFRGRYRACAIK